MTSIGVCADTSEAVELLEAQGLYLKPIAKLNISVQLPQLKSPGSSISNWEVMEKLKKMIKPENFLVLKVLTYCCICANFIANKLIDRLMDRSIDYRPRLATRPPCM